MPVLQNYPFLSNLYLEKFFCRAAILFFILIANPLLAQDDLNVHGVVSDAMTAAKLNEVKVSVKMDGSDADSFTTRANGKYEFYLDCGHKYTFLFSKPGYVTRSIVIDASGIPQEVIGAGFIMPTDMSMFKETEAMASMDMSVFDKPIGIAKFDPAKADFAWDFEYTSKLKAQIDNLLRESERKEKELAKEAEAAAAEAKKLEENFAKAMSNGAKSFSAGDYAGAVDSYNQAVELKPDNTEAKAKLTTAKDKLAEKQAAEQKDQQYASLLDEADSFYRTEDFKQAIEKYQAALVIKSAETYPKEQIAKAEKIVAERAAQAQKQQDFNALVTAGDKAVADAEFQSAVAKYEEALALISDKSVEKKLGDAKAAIAAQAEAEKQRQQYEGLIASADQLFKAESFEEAKAKYQQAAALLPKEEYPKTKIAEIDSNLAQLADAAKKEAAFEELLAKGDSEMGAEKYDAAIGFFEQATELLPDNQSAKTKLAAARQALAQQQEAEMKEKNYVETLAEADAYFKSEDLVSAKTKYQAALELKPKETYPQTQLEAIAAREAELAAAQQEQAAREAQFNKLVTAGDKATAAADYASAIANYKEALKMEPADEAVQGKLASAQQLLGEKEQLAAENEQYNSLIAAADQKYSGENLKGALADYQAAQQLKPAESFPAEQIAKIEAAFADAEAQKKAAEQEAKIQAQYAEAVESGTKNLSKSDFAKAKSDFQTALELLPGDAIATAKLAEAQAELDKLNAAAAEEEQYAALVSEGDRLYKAADYQMAKMQYEDALAMRPEEKYPKNQLEKIEAELAKAALANKQQEAAEQEQRYLDIISRGDNKRDSKEYSEAIAAYSEALELKPEEYYPKAQIERLEKLIEEEKLRAEREEQRRRDEQADEDARVEYKRVSGNSEDQAEQFMREARLAQEAEKYDRLKKFQKNLAETQAEYQEGANFTREENVNSLEAYRRPYTEQFDKAVASQAKNVKHALRSKEALIAENQERQKTNEEKNRQDYSEVNAVEQKMQTVIDNSEKKQSKRAKAVQQSNQNYQQQSKERAGAGYQKTLEQGSTMQQLKETYSKQEKERAERRTDNAEEVVQQNQVQAQFTAKLQRDNKESVQARGEQFQAQKEAMSKQSQERSRTMVEDNYTEQQLKERAYQAKLSQLGAGSEQRRQENLDALQNLRQEQGKQHNTAYKSELVEKYPQGVTEESSTMGNKVIITRVVVKGNKADEYKKVLDRAGNYYFKNGQSISEETWNRETIEAFESKD